MKRMLLKTAAVAGITVACMGGAAAQDPYVYGSPRTLELTLEQAIEIALDENPTIQVAELEIEKQTYVRKETVGNHLPSVTVDGQYNRAIKKSNMGGGVSFDPRNTVVVNTNLVVPLFAPAVYKTLKLNDEQMRAAVEDARGSRITLVNEVKKSYYNILLAEESLEVLRTSEANLRQTVDETKLKFDNGLASEYDYITADVQLSNLQPTIIQTESSIEVAKKLLKMYMGVPLDYDIVIAGNLNTIGNAIETAGFDYYGENISGNSDLRALDIQVDLLRRQLEVSKTSRMPTIAAFGSYNLTGRDPLNLGSLTGDTSGGGSQSFFWNHPVSAGLTVSIPLFSGFTNRYRDKQIKYSISQASLQRDYLEESTKVQVYNAINDILTAEAAMIANEATITQAQKGYDISRTRYDNGVGTMLEVNSAELALTQAKLNYNQAVYDFLSAQADYEKVIGIDY
ncbi:MAG: TolC family protein [Alistipes sp.]|nr:TolC family protein [Alistipes sp.]